MQYKATVIFRKTGDTEIKEGMPSISAAATWAKKIIRNSIRNKEPPYNSSVQVSIIEEDEIRIIFLKNGTEQSMYRTLGLYT